MPLHSFSVAICTRNRAQLLERAAVAIFQQDYPQDLYELILVDNGSSDGTPAVAAQLAARAPVPVRYVVESQLGISPARNRAVREARFDYVAYVDDDVRVAPDWLSAMNAAIEQTGALAVGGRIEEEYENGFAPPSWLDCRYLKGFFRVEYDGRRPPLFALQPPDYIGAGSSVYAKELFDRFGGFSVAFGVRGKKRLRGNETYFNGILKRAGVPIYYTDAAVSWHLVTPAQVTRRSLLKASSLGGLESARIDTEHVHAREAAGMILQRLRELPGLVLGSSRAGVFCRSCQLARNTVFMLEASRLLIRKSLGSPRRSS